MRRDRLVILAIAAVILIAALIGHALTLNLLLAIAVLVPSVILHEISHGIVANHFGDPTAKERGRLTLNPLVHLDPFGSLILPSLLALLGMPPIGYAKPVPVDVTRLRNRRNTVVIVALAGPATNLLISIASGIALRGFLSQLLTTNGSIGAGFMALFYAGVVNLLLAVFNLIPIPPLDGSAILERLLPHAAWSSYLRFRTYFIVVIVLVAVLAPGVLQAIYSPFESLWLRIFTGA